VYNRTVSCLPTSQQNVTHFIFIRMTVLFSVPVYRWFPKEFITLYFIYNGFQMVSSYTLWIKGPWHEILYHCFFLLHNFFKQLLLGPWYWLWIRSIYSNMKLLILATALSMTPLSPKTILESVSLLMAAYNYKYYVLIPVCLITGTFLIKMKNHGNM
jgi:hypothetical protein